jgi:multicomponent Na+:H+ antiporter subunit F
MTSLYLLVATALLISLSGGMYRVMRGPTPGDRMLVIQLFGTAAVAVLILIGEAINDSTLVDVALVLALLAAVTMIAFVRCAWKVEDIDDPHN